MSSVRDLARNMQLFIDHRSKTWVDRAFRASLDVTAMEKSRIINDRVDHLGNSFGIYAESTQEAKIKKGRTEPTNNPLLFDSGFNSLDFPNVNFSDTNRMHNSTGPSIESASKDQVVIRIKARGDREPIMIQLEERFGKFLRLSENEEQFIIDLYENDLDKDLTQYNLN